MKSSLLIMIMAGLGVLAAPMSVRKGMYSTFFIQRRILTFAIELIARGNASSNSPPRKRLTEYSCPRRG